ncbi:bifunctional 2-polyprenyl-6-hydroxyphenol methylase/3-demethylubiquinol 3-O-methyltransferase UbiG [Kineosporia sp. A_224]|uniref:class I SAM-dependent methyltransferase n=1 Tax=Kineosporia sp. A_224 TaxID=1962180 RepID=UPI000B4ABE2B|nr:methyltransferase domain-containing protein [Kineosporia sp. A_224]
MTDPAGPAQRAGARLDAVARGLRHPRRQLRRFQAARRRRLLLEANRRLEASRRPDASGSPLPEGCLVCGSTKTRSQTVQRPKRAYELRICSQCGYVSNGTNTVDYTKFTSVNRFELTARVGTADRPGREFQMARMGVQVLGRTGLRVNVFGAGRSQDYLHVRALPGVERAIISDVVDLGLDEDFLNVRDGTTERFDLVVACEVVEHFTDPTTEFRRLFDLLTPQGLLVCSTNIYDGGNLERQEYLYRRGHVSYYAPRTIARIARASGVRFDFRVPQMATSTGGPRKRYVLFSPSADVMDRVAVYFGQHMYAPSEDPNVDLTPKTATSLPVAGPSPSA